MSRHVDSGVRLKTCNSYGVFSISIKFIMFNYDLIFRGHCFHQKDKSSFLKESLYLFYFPDL